MPEPRWKGSKQIHLQPGYPDTTETASGTKTVLVYHGPYKTLQAQKPRVGQKVTGYGDLTVEQVGVKPREAGPIGPGIMTITLSNDSSPTDMVTSGGSDVVEEIEWVDLNRKLEQHPMYSSGGANALTDTDLDQIEEWRNADTRAKRNTVYGGLSDHAKHFVDKIRRGQESYIAPAPVARRTTRSFLAPSSSTMGKRVGKPMAKAPNGYEWLTTADKATRTGSKGKWERVEEFTGATKWDSDIYPAG